MSLNSGGTWLEKYVELVRWAAERPHRTGRTIALLLATAAIISALVWLTIILTRYFA
ncbi:hypothetical protein [Streptomyces antibioticus]|uniref:hypothetical protein n=1 Tax=Streptomyces antibioticus TaxID=1890 RepID=UPI0019606709|nr:hypothetical protein [Streptomyces sp. S9]